MLCDNLYNLLGDFMKVISFVYSVLLSVFFMSSAYLSAADKNINIGIVDFAKCIMESKYGKVEQENFENMKNQMHKAIEDLDSQMNSLAKDLQDPDLLDSMSAETEKEKKMQLQSLGEEMNRYETSYYQRLQQANMQIMQTMSNLVNKASENVAKKEKLLIILRSDMAPHYSSTLDVTKQILEELEKQYEESLAASRKAINESPETTPSTAIAPSTATEG